MSSNQNNYNHRGGGNYGIVLAVQTSLARIGWYITTLTGTVGPVIRDFLSNQRLDNEHSPLQVADVEADATYDEFPAWCNVENNPDQWKSLPKSSYHRCVPNWWPSAF